MTRAAEPGSGFDGSDALREEAHAKINLTLEVIGKRGDGYHNLVSVMQTVELHDVLTFTPAEGLRVTCSDAGIPVESNLALLAARELQRHTGTGLGARIHLEKNIPLASGLGGGSADAAAALRGLNRMWRTGLSADRLREIGARVGSDVPFLVDGGTALVQGRGEEVKTLPRANVEWIVIASPASLVEGKTGVMFSRLDPSTFTRGALSHKLAGRIIAGSDVPQELLFNVFGEIAQNVFPHVEEANYALKSLGAREVFLSGAGPSIFAIPPSREIGTAWQLLMEQRGIRAFLTKPWWPALQT